jgi:uncharacterized protein (DUF302 family)
MRSGDDCTFINTLIEREDIPTGLDYNTLVAAFESELGRWDQTVGNLMIQEKTSWPTVKRVIQDMAGPHGLMIFYRIDQGSIISLHNGIKRCSLYLVGNPVIAEQILSIDIRASLYVPFRVCLYDDGNPAGASISFDRPSSFLATFHQPALMKIGCTLNSKIYSVVHSIVSKN